MSRILSFAPFAVVVALIVPSTAAVAQESDSCQKCPVCPVVNFECLGVEFKADHAGKLESVRSQPSAKKNEISIELAFNCDVPFLKSLPFIQQVIGSAFPADDCEIFVFDSVGDLHGYTCKSGSCCRNCETCQNDSKCGEQSGRSCYEAPENSIAAGCVLRWPAAIPEQPSIRQPALQECWLFVVSGMRSRLC